MSGICGWAGVAVVPVDERATLVARMLTPPGVSVRALPDSRIDVADAPVELAAASPGDIASASSDRDLCAVIAGHFWFSDAALEDAARSVGPARALIDGWRAYDTRVLGMLDGAFSLAVWSTTKRELLIATDRFSICPLAYVETTGGIVFAPNAAALRLHPAVATTLDSQAIYDYLYFSAIPSPHSIYREVRRLEPAQYVLWRGGRATPARYWLPAFNATRQSDRTLERELPEVLAAAVAHCDPEKRAGAFLSGGLDSSTVSGLLGLHQGRPAKTFSIGFDASGYDEIAYARVAAKHFGCDGHEYYVTPRDVAETIERIAHAYDEPFGNSSAVPTYCCARLAADKGVTVMLAGDGGDELFAGNERYAKQKLFELWFRIPEALRTLVAEPLAFRAPLTRHTAFMGKLRRYIEQARVPLPDRMQTHNLLHMVPNTDIFSAAFVRGVDPVRPLSLLRDEYQHVEADPVDRMLFLDWKFTLADNDLRKVTAMCAQAGVRVRYPMLTGDVVGLSTRVPATLKLRGLQLRYFYRNAMRGFLPREVLAKSKHGFGLPFGVWLATSPELMGITDECIARMRKREIFQPHYLDELRRRHRTEHAAYYGSMVWLVMSLELWLAANGF